MNPTNSDSISDAVDAQNHSGNSLTDLFASELVVVNVGLDGFADELQANGTQVIPIAWRPPGGGDIAIANLVACLSS